MERKTLSAHEISKYDYCPYQWYYERLYGRKELRRLYVERNTRLNLEDSLASEFRKGEKYHRRSYRMLKFRRMLWKLIVILFAAALIAGYLWIQNGGVV
ncbi:MAG: hypothetical protein IKA89_07025 [Anaerotignum sp.]|nr:hypothetical protein [Anaerotignum sp.]MBR2383481.1 hypothetical protein [Anaerotignum sp.]MBR2851503.1 hypothetical protein [Anaerotignum sp.]MBR3993305.1 hypothetical protein [Anaerotignum sp.]MBR4113029.1 hypothetical protein [Anaerotignum sp.]